MTTRDVPIEPGGSSATIDKGLLAILAVTMLGPPSAPVHPGGRRGAGASRRDSVGSTVEAVVIGGRVMLAGRARKLLRTPGIVRRVDRAAGGVMIGAGVAVVATH
ncbi:hypothetical protein NKI77_20870 [Mesorhizobium opportunistum]|uniref:Uncharacterized protein n=1 Tax=Mesorhizobium opportunistum TaxID=593909 RepID=A0ABV1YN21_9HYPH|nr:MULTISPECIES: hypothetical protein [Mesorhizobium]ESY63325.1 hypothetical protein X742_29570 [Mesorhizobium sp. LNHC232B00]WJI39795.1 hypothetical protein NL534_05945 [Mesorhizobium opportunistum]